MIALAVAFGVLASAVILLRRRLFFVVVAGASMEPNLHDGERLLARRTTIARVRRGDVVILERPDENLANRVPPGRLVAFGNNVHHSLDSQQIGYFPTDRLIGVLRPVYRRDAAASFAHREAR